MCPVWKRPLDKVPYPNTWLEFTAKESFNSDKLIKYRIQDIPENRFDDAIEHIRTHFLIDSPVSKFFGAATNKTYVEDYLRSCKKQIQMKTSLICLREGSDDIVGVSITYITTKDDPFWTEMRALAQSQAYRDHLDMSKIIKGDSDIFTKYKADKIYSSISLSVDPNYRGCSIGRRLIEARKPFCKAFDIPVTQSLFVSDQSNYLADKLGFKIDSIYTIDELNSAFTKYPLKIESKALAYKSWNFE